MSIRSRWLKVLFRLLYSFWVFFVFNCSFKYWVKNVKISNYDLSFSCCLTCFETLLLTENRVITIMPSWYTDLFIIMKSISVSSNVPCFEVYSFSENIFMFIVCRHIIVPSFHFVIYLYLCIWSISFVDSIWLGLVFFYLVWQSLLLIWVFNPFILNVSN